MAERPLYTLYKNLKAQNYDVPNDYNKFESALTRDGKSGADNRHAIYENLKAQNFDVPDTYERFYTALFEPRSKTSSRAKGGSVPMSAADRARFSAGAAAISASAKQMANNAGRYNRLNQRKQKQQKDFGRVNLGTHLTPFGGDANDVVKDEFAYNPETGKAGAYVTSDNENAYTQSDAEQRQAILDKYGEEWNKAVDMGMVPSELDKADPDMSDTDVAMRQMERRQEWLDENQNRRSKELNESMHLQGSPFVASGGAVAPSSFNTAIGNEANRLSDAEYGAYNTAKAYNQMLRTTLLQELKEQKQRNEDAGWWKDKWNDVSNYFGGMFDTMLDPKLYSQGVMDAAIASNLLQVKKGMEEGTIKKGSNAGDAAQVMLSAIQQQQGEAAKQQQNGTKAYQYGDVSGRSLKFMGDFALSGWRNVMTTGFTKAGEKVGEKMALGALGKWFTKNTGRVLGDMAGSAALAATNQLGSTYNNVIERYVGMNNENGGVTQDKDGDLSFNKGVSLGKAIKDGLGSATIENFSEMFGEYLPGASKILSKLGLSKVSSFFEKIGNNAYYKWLSNATNKSGIQGVMSEIAEEEFGTALHAAWGDGDGSWSDFNVFTNPDAREKQIDTCLGMFYSVGFMQSPRTAVGAINAVKYFHIKLQVTKADKFGQMMFNDKWDDIKSKIDVTTNADLTKTVLDATRSDSMTSKQKGAVINYAMFLSKLRGFNQASDAKTKDKVEEGETVPTLSNYLDDAYTEGHNADDADKHDIQIQHEDQSKTLAAALNISEQQLSGMSDEELESLTGQDDKLDQAIYDYQLSSARYQGVVDDAQDKVDLAAHQAEQRVNMYTDQSRGSVRNATIKASGGAEDYGVYIISGNIATRDDGSIDVSNSDDMILYFDPTTNSVEHADALMFAELGEELPAVDVKAQAMADAKEKAIKETTGIIDGVVEVGTQFKTVDADGTEHTYEVLADNGDGTAMITIDGNVPTELVKGENVQIPYSFEDLQKMKDEADQQRLQAAKAQREQMEKERAEQQMQSQTTQAENPAHEDNIQSAPIEDNIDYSDIIREDGKVQMVDVSDKYGNNLFPDAKDVFYIQGNKMRTKFAYIDANGELKTQSFPTGLVKIKIRGEVSVDDYKKYRNTILAAESSFIPESSKIEDNSGENRGEIEEEATTTEGEAAGPAEETTTSESGEDSATEQNPAAEQTPAITLEDGTIVPMLEDGNPDFSKLSAAQTAELYDTQFDEDADGIVSGYVSDAKKALDKANNMTVKGKTFVEQKAAKAAKEKAIADAQAAYDSAVAIRDAYNERQLAKEENTNDNRNTPELSHEQQKAMEEGEKLGFPAVDKEGEPINQNVIELANWAKEQGLEIDPTSKLNSYADLYVMCKDGFGVSTLVPDVGENINQVFYLPDNVQGEQLLKLQEEFNVGRELKHSADMNSEITEGAMFYDGDTAREFKEFVDKKVEEQNKVFGEQRPEEDLPFSAKENGKQQTTAERAADVERNKVDDMKVVDNIVGKKTRKVLEKLAKMMGANVQWQYSDKNANGWFDDKTNTIYLTLDSSITEGVQFIFGHEMTHEMRTKNPAAYDELKTLVKDMMGEDAFNSETDRITSLYNENNVFYNGGRTAYEEEVVADQLGKWIRDANYAHTLLLKMSHPLLARLHEIVNRFLMALHGIEFSDDMRLILRSIEQAYVKTANGQVTNSETGEDVSFSLRLKSAIEDTETNPSDAQKESGNYKKGHIKFGGYDYTIENPKGSTRSGKDADGKEWKITMHDTYGYIRGKFGKDGDHLDMFINDKADLDNWDGDVFVVDQVNSDGSFDEHKVMYGYYSMDDAEKAYLANYSKGWKGLGSITGVSKDEFDKWLDTSKRKLKPFADYAKVKFSQAQSVSEPRYSLKDIKPVGVGAFGNIYNQFRGNAKAAIEFLKKVRGGEAVGALHHKDIGDIDLVWGKEGTGHSDGYGLSKLVKYHPEVLDNLQEILNDMRVVSSSKNRVNLESETHKAGVRLTWDGERKSWLLTAFKKETSASDKRTDTAATSLEGDTALSQTEGSAAKIDNSSETAKENGEKFSLKDEKTLAGVHNITEEKLRKALKLGGFANPSLAVIDTSKSGHDNFGEISFIAPSVLLDKRTGKTGGTWITDAYTQRYPSVERQMSEKGYRKFEDWVDSLDYPSGAKAEIKRQTKDVLEDNGVPAWELMYLKEKGIDIKAYDSNVDYRWKEIINKYPTAEDILNNMKNDAELNEEVTSLAKYEIVKPTRDKISLEVRRQIYKETGVKTSPISPKVRKKVNEIFDRDYKSTLLDKDGKPKAEDVKKVVEDIVQEHNDTKKYDFYLSKVQASNYVNTNGLYDDYIRWQEKKLDEFGTKNRIFRGYKPDGSRKYVPETLENVSKAMREEADGQTNGSEYTSFGSFIAKIASRVDSTDEMRANKDKLSSNEDKKKFYEKWSEVYYDLAKFLYNDVFYGEQRLHDIVLQSDPKKYAKKEYDITLTPTFMKKLDALKNAVQTELKSAYFETKYNRPLRLNEFAAAVVPDNLGEDVRKGIEDAGLPMYNYDPNKEGDRSRAFNEAINSSDNIRFSLRNLDQDYLDAVKKGDMEKAQRLVNKAAAVAGYSTDSSYQGTSAFNGSAPWGNGYFLTKEERKEAWNNGEFEGESTLGDYINDDIDGGNLEALTNTASYRAADPMRKEAIDNVRNAILKKSKFITMYRSVPSDVREESFRNGDWVTPSRAYAVDNAKLHGWGDDYNIIEQKVPVDDVWFDGNDIAEWGYGIEKDYINDTDFAYKNTKNNRKLLDVVTYNDDGEVIPLSQRFDPSKSDVRFSLRGSTPYDKQMEEWKEKNHLEKDATPMKKPVMKEGENIFDYANRMVEWTRNQNLWKTAPKQTGFQDALDKWKADNGIAPGAYPPVHPIYEDFQDSDDYNQAVAEYRKEKEVWKTAPKPKDFYLSVDLDDMNKQLRNIRRAVLNQKNYDQRTVKAVSDLVRKMLNIGWGDGLSRGKVGNLLSAAKNATGANDVKKYLDKVIGILAENYLNRLSTAYDNLINTKGARADQSGVIKIGSLDAKGQAFMSEYKKAMNMDDSSLNNYIANIEEDSAKNEDNVEMNDYRLAGIQAAIMYKQQIGGNDADIAELKRQIGELKNKKDATKVDKDLLKSLEKKLFENKFDRITMYENLLNNIQRMVKESKGRAKEFRDKITEHKNEILHRANLDLEGVDSTYYDTTTAKKKFVNNDLQRAVFSSTYTFEQFLKFFGKHSANGEGRLYNYFHKLNQDALDEEQLYNEMNRNALDEKTKELFGKEKFMKLVGIDGKGMKEMDIEVTDHSNKKTGKRTIHLKQGQMLYIYLVNKETDGEMKLRAMGITEEDVAAIEENLDPRVKAMGVWLQDEYLPECQRRYQATHTKYFGSPMKEVENYFPLAINNRARNVKEDVNQDSDAMSQLAGTSTGAIVTRRVNVIPLDIENADAFEVAFNHLQEMEEWSAMLPFRQDINTLLSYTHFRNQVQNMSSVAYGSGKTLWDEFKQTAQIAAGTYKPKVNAGMMDSRIAAAMGGIAVAKISGRLWTAIKQSQSATVFLPECDFTRFVKNGVNPYGSWKWAMENIPDFRKRVENMTYGDVKLRQYLDELEKWHDWTKTISKIGMAPNILVDGITCAVGARSVYETEVNRLTKLGYPKDKAEEKAYYKAVAAYNKTQQSSGGMYLSPMQVDRTYVSAALSLFKNANYAYGRMQIEACRGLARTYDFWGGKHKTTLIESMTRQIMGEDGLNENTARTIAKATYNRTFRQSIGRLINFATLIPVTWALYKVLPYLLTGDDDDKKKDMIEEAVLKGFVTSLSDNYVIPFVSNILNAGLKVEDGKPTFDPEVFRYQNLYINPATSDLANIYSMVGNQKWYSVVNKLGMLGVQSLIGFNPETVGALYQAFAEADYDNGNTAKEWQIGILKAISAPEESIRELYMDELGLKSGDIKKIPLAELEKRYAERQINRDNLLSQIGMDSETFNGYVDKYQKSFEKKIKDKMDKWDEYDKKKADEFFDTTSDPKLKDMIEKKRAKDANAAADEQIAKEGLSQEKKGKELNEEAYDAVKMSIDVAEDNAISTYNKVLNKRYAALNDEYNEQTDAMKYIFMSKHPLFKAYKNLESEYTNYGKKIKELKEKLVSAKGHDAKQAILKQIRSERDRFYELQSNVR